jgi:spore maturation protein CgeB
MKILLYGETTTISSGAWCYAESIYELGYELHCYENDSFIHQYNTCVFWKIMRRLNGRRILGLHRKKHVNGLVQVAGLHKPDIIIILKGLLLGPADIAALKTHAAFVVVINHDDYFSKSINSISKLQFDAIPYYDFVFVTKEVNVAEISKYNKAVEFFPFAYYPVIHKKHVLSEAEKIKYETDILFIGTHEQERVALMEYLVSKTNYKLSMYGGNWHLLTGSSVLQKCDIHHREIIMEDMAKAIQGAKITLGFLRKSNRDTYTQRSFEIPACGGVFLAERTSFHRKLYEENVEAVFFDVLKPEELLDKVNYLMEHAVFREAVREAGYKKVIISGYTYVNRILQITNKFEQHKRFAKTAG